VRLAAKLVGWRIDIKSEEEKRQEVEAEMARMARVVAELRSLPGVGEKTIQKLIDAGIGGLAHLLVLSDDELCVIEGIGPKTAEKIRQAALQAKEEWDRRDAEAVAQQELAAAQAAQAVVEEESATEAGSVEANETTAEEGASEPAQAAPPEEAAGAQSETQDDGEPQNETGGDPEPAA
jgi:N utilization substance protein A